MTNKNLLIHRIYNQNQQFMYTCIPNHNTPELQQNNYKIHELIQNVILKVNKNPGCLQPCEERTTTRWARLGRQTVVADVPARHGRAGHDAMWARSGLARARPARRGCGRSGRGTTRTVRWGAVGVGGAPAGSAGEREGERAWASSAGEGERIRLPFIVGEGERKGVVAP
jgi:hypothetical protein